MRKPTTILAALALAAAACGGTSTVNGPTFESRLTAIATQAGLDVAAWKSCRADAAVATRVDADRTLGLAKGVSGTPTFLVNGAVLLGAQPASAFRAAIQAAKTQAQASGLSAPQYYDATFPDVPIGSSAVSGPADAWVTIVEFSDFECPYCAAVQPALETALAEAGADARLVFKNFPLSRHAQAVPTAIAAECAHGQGRFWEFHDLVFAQQSALFD
jgi:protein-disulfide isomerase